MPQCRKKFYFRHLGNGIFLSSSQIRIISKDHDHPLSAKTVQNQNVFKVKADILAIDGPARQPQGKNWQRLACCSSSRWPGC